MASIMRNGLFAGIFAVILVAGGTACSISVSSASEGNQKSPGLQSGTDEGWVLDPESMLRHARARLGIGAGALPPFSPLAPNPVVPDGQLGEFRHGAWPSLGVGDGNWTHAGVDLSAPCGSRVLAFADGTVVDRIAGPTEPNFDSLGYMVLIEHPEALLGRGFRTLYLHLEDPPRIAVGDKVEGGRTVIGEVGATGAALGCHLHFEARFFAGRFHPDWDNVYGRGDRRSSEELHRDWIDPELLFQAFPEGLSAAAVATGSQAGSPATTTAAARESSGPAVDSGAPAGDLILALEELHRAIDDKIERDLDTVAFAYWSAFDIQRARRPADWIMAPVELIKTALDVHLFAEGIGGIQSRIEHARSALELAALTTGLVQAHEGVGQLLLDGPEVGAAIDVMIKRASAHPRDAQAFQAVIRRYLQGEGGLASPVALATPGVPNAQELIRGVREVRRALADELSRLNADLAASPPDPAIAEQAARMVGELTQAVKRSTVEGQEVPLPETAGATAPDALRLGAVTDLNRVWTQALANYDRDMAIEQVVAVTSITKLGVSYLTIGVDAVGATGAATHLVQSLATAFELGTFAAELVFNTRAREQVGTLPHQMALALTPELANVWRLVGAVERAARGESEAAQPAGGSLVAAAPEVIAGGTGAGHELEITMRDGGVVEGQLGGAKAPYVTAYGTIEIALDAIRRFAEGRLELEDGSVLIGSFGDVEFAVATGHGALRMPAREIVAISRGPTSEPAVEEIPTETSAPAAAQNQGVLVGRVLNSFDQPVSGATVRIVGSNLRATTDATGNYRLAYAPGKFRALIEKEGHDSEEIELDLAQASTYPLKDKYLTSVPSRPGLYFWGKLDWQAISACRVEQVEKDRGDFARGSVNRFVAYGEPSVIVHDGTPYFLDLSGAKQVALLPVAADGTILRIVRKGGWSGWNSMFSDPKSAIEESAISLRSGKIGDERRILAADLRPGVYAFVSRSLGLGPIQSVPTGICFKFELRAAAEVKKEESAASAIEGAVTVSLLEQACARLVWNPASGSEPPCPFADPDGCPFEGCQYGKWKARAATPLYSAVDSADVVMVVQPGEIVTATRGIVYSVPCPTRVLYPIPGFSENEIVFRVTYLGEGAYRYWREAGLTDGWIDSCSVQRAPSPSCWSEPLVTCSDESVWWAEIRTASGAVGWTRETENFSGKDALG